MLTVLKIFFSSRGSNAWLVLGCLILASLSEGLGIASLLPLIATLSDSQGGEVSGLHQKVLEVLDFLGLPKEFETLLLVVVGLTLAKGILILFAMRYVGFAVAQVSMKLRSQIINGVLRARWSFFVGQPVGRITSAVGGEAAGAVAAFRTAADFLADVIQTVAYLTIAFLMSWRLTVAAIVAGGLMLFLLNFFVDMSRRAGEKQTLRTRELMTHLIDILNNIKPLKAMDRQNVSQEYMRDKLLKLRKAMRKEVSSIVFLKRSQELLITLALGAGLYAAVRLLNTDLAELLVVAVVIMRVIKNLARIQRQYQMAARVEAPYRAVHKFMREIERAEERVHGSVEPEFKKACRIRNLEFSFGEKSVLKGVDLDIPARGITVLMGESGAGKSSLSDILLGFYEPQAGKLLIDDVPLSKVDVHKWRQMIGYVPQELQLFHDSIMANVTLGDPSIGEDQVRDALRAAGALEFVDALQDGVHSLAGERGSQLSGGQRQRIALARALARRPKLLILDEVTSALDPATEREICNTLRALSKSTAILAITHQPQLLESADRAYRLEGGRAKRIDLSDRLAV